MKQSLVTLVVAAAASMPAAAQPQAPPSPPPQQQISKEPAMGEEKRVKAENIDSVMSKGGMILLDVREPKEIAELGGYEGAINIPLPELEKRLGELPKDKTILTA